MTVICCGCQREKGEDGRYRPRRLDIDRAELVSHGLCAACADHTLRPIRNRQARPACQEEVRPW